MVGIAKKMAVQELFEKLKRDHEGLRRYRGQENNDINFNYTIIMGLGFRVKDDFGLLESRGQEECRYDVLQQIS